MTITMSNLKKKTKATATKINIILSFLFILGGGPECISRSFSECFLEALRQNEAIHKKGKPASC